MYVCNYTSQCMSFRHPEDVIVQMCETNACCYVSRLNCVRPNYVFQYNYSNQSTKFALLFYRTTYVLISFMKQIYLNAISSILFINSYNHSLDIIPVINKQVPTKTSLSLVLHSSNTLYHRSQY